MTEERAGLPYLTQEDRLKIYQVLIEGCKHLWSKNKLQEERVKPVLEALYELSETDPYFLAHFTAWVFDKDESKDLKVTSLYINSLSSADGRRFSQDSKYSKPNLRYISSVLLQKLDPKMASRVQELGTLKWGVGDKLRTGTHLPTSLKTAFKKYLKYREANLHIVEGIVKAGLGKVYKNLYRWQHMTPEDEVAGLLKWQQKDRKIEFKEIGAEFKDKEDLEIAELIRDKKMGYFQVMAGLSKAKKKVSPVIAVAILEQVTGNQAVILRSFFEEQGVLTNKEVLELYEKKISEAKTALDRAEGASKTASEEVEQALKTARASKRKEQMGEIGKIFLHVDYSISMRGALEYAKENAAIIAEMVKDPKDNFGWGLFSESTYNEVLPVPDEFVKDAFHALLFGKRTGGSTDAFALYPEARTMGAEVDIFVSDGEHNMGDLGSKIRSFHETHPDHPKPKAVVLIRVSDSVYSREDMSIKEAYTENGIPYAEMKPETLHDSALVTQAVKNAIVGPLAIIEEIMNTKLPEYPQWWYTI